MPAARKRAIWWVIFALAHAAVTVMAFLLYMDYAIKVDHGLLTPSLAGTASQYIKSLFFLPLLWPVLRWRADLATGPLGYLLVLANSAVWALACSWIWRRVQRWRNRPRTVPRS